MRVDELPIRKHGAFVKYLANILFVLVAYPAHSAAQCAPPPLDVQQRVATYAAQKFHVEPTVVRVTSLSRVGQSCFWAIGLEAGSESVLTLYLSPDLKFVTLELFDLSKNPLDDERQKEGQVIGKLMAKRSATKGAEHPLVTVVEFSDLECPFCKKLNSSLNELLATANPQDIRVVFKNFPLPNHLWAEAAARFGDCIQRQNESVFWSYQDFIFAKQSSIGSEDDLVQKSIEFVGRTDIFAGDIRICMSSPETTSSLEADLALAQALNVRSTPTLFINGNRYEGTRNLLQLQTVVEQIRRRAHERVR